MGFTLAAADVRGHHARRARQPVRRAGRAPSSSACSSSCGPGSSRASIELKNVGALAHLIVVLLVRPQGLLGTEGAHRMNWCTDLLERPLRGDQRERRSATPDRDRASTCTSATPACSTSARRASPRSARTRVAIPSSRYGWPFWRSRAAHASSAAIVLALLLGIPTLRLRADYLAIVTIAAAEIIRIVAQLRAVHVAHRRQRRAPEVHRPTSRRSTRSPSHNGTSSGPQTFGELRPVHHHRRLDRSSRIVAASVYLLMRSPWGRVLKSIREDEDAARSLGKNVFAYKMQSLVLGGVIGALGGGASRSATGSPSPTTSAPRSRSSPTPSSSSAAWPGSRDRSSAR